MSSVHPLHPARWVLEQLERDGWTAPRLISFTRASTLCLARRGDHEPVVVKAAFGSDHVIEELPPTDRPLAYGFYWYRQLGPDGRRLARADFQHEISITRAAAGIDGVVPLLESHQGERLDWYSMPYLAGGDLRPLVTAADRDIVHCLQVLADVARGLSELHERGIVHRDVYAENILTDGRNGFITDLGAARHTTEPRGPISRPPEPHWPPEYSVFYATATPAADVYSLSVLLYRLVCGDLPRLHGDGLLQLLPQTLIGICSAGLEHAPENRPSASEMHSALREATDAAQ